MPFYCIIWFKRYLTTNTFIRENGQFLIFDDSVGKIEKFETFSHGIEPVRLGRKFKTVNFIVNEIVNEMK